MPTRAVILAVEKYPQMSARSLTDQLEGTIKDAEAFQNWLIQTKKVLPENIAFLINPTKTQISFAFRDLVDEGKDQTEELYVFYSGHGFTFTDSPMKQKPADIIVGSEFKNARDSGDACLNLQAIQYALYQCIGPGVHFFFVDACRNLIRTGDVDPGVLGWRRDLSQLGQPSQFTLFSTERGSVALARSAFAPALVNGLAGYGRAKRRDGVSMWVSFDSLRAYLEKNLTQKIDSEPGSGPGRILEINPIPNYTCVVKVRNATEADKFKMVLQDWYLRPIGAPTIFIGRETRFIQPPDDYHVKVTADTAVIKPEASLNADLYEDCTLEFEKFDNLSPEATHPQPTPPGNPMIDLTVTAPDDTKLEFVNLNTGEVLRGQPEVPSRIRRGVYKVRVLESGWTAVREQFVDFVKQAAPVKLDLSPSKRSPLRDSLLSKIGGAHAGGRVDFSESLGPMAVQDLGLWLSLIGASRIYGPNHFDKLGSLPLERFEDMKKDCSAIYVLAGVENADESVRIAVTNNTDPSVTRLMNPVPELQGICQQRTNTPTGLHLVHLQVGDRGVLTTVTYCLPNRVTLFTVAVDKGGQARIHQFLLPASHLIDHLTQDEKWGQPSNVLDAVRFMTLAQKQLARRRSPNPKDQELPKDASDPKLVEDQNRWSSLLYGKWLDPIMAIMASYEILRNQTAQSADPFFTEVVLANLLKTYPAIPDVQILTNLAKLTNADPPTAPIFLSGVQALKDPEKVLPYPLGKLDYTGPWVTWIGVSK